VVERSGGRAADSGSAASRMGGGRQCKWHIEAGERGRLTGGAGWHSTSRHD
jgi:hypothetical protein